MDKHKTTKKHIDAARGWLSQAEDSLKKENDVRGDLSLMLAQAELQRAQEKNPARWLIWAKRLLPVAIAILAGVVYALFLRQVPVAQEGMQDKPSSVRVEQSMPEENGPASRGIPAQIIPDSDIIDKVEEIGPADDHSIPVQPRADVQVEAGGASGQPVESQPEAAPEVPAPEMQKLMQAAGNILRE